MSPPDAKCAVCDVLRGVNDRDHTEVKANVSMLFDRLDELKMHQQRWIGGLSVALFLFAAVQVLIKIWKS